MSSWTCQSNISLKYREVFKKIEISKAVSNLSPLEREYILLRFWYGFSLKEIERQMGPEAILCWKGSSGARSKLIQSLSHLVAGA